MSSYHDEGGVDYSEVSPPRATLKPVRGEWSDEPWSFVAPEVE